MFVPITFVTLFSVAVANTKFAEKEHLLPSLFHLDDYERCLSSRDGLYCLGIFDLAPTDHQHPSYDLMQEFSHEITNYNRTRIHRGYCVSARCPFVERERNASLRFERERNATLRFERCAAKWARKRALNATLRELKYCRQREKAPESTGDTWHLVFTAVVRVIMLLNIVGTVYDVRTGDEKQKNSLLLSWSVRYNWRRLTQQESGDKPQMSTGPGMRVFLMLIMIQVHNGLLHHTAYLQNPLFIEEMTRHPLMMIIQNGTSSTQLYVIMSTFLGSYYLLKSTEGSASFSSVLKHILRRVVRLTPVHLFVVGFAATRWRGMSDGPLWSAVVGEQSDVCRQKFWYHAFYVSNLLEPEVPCLIPTWFICVDLQLHIIGAIFTVALARARHAIPILAAMFVLSCLLNAVLAYVNNWTAMLYVVQSPENVRTLFRDIPSYYNYYISPWGALPTCFLGLIAAQYFSRRSPSHTKGVGAKVQSSRFQTLKLLGYLCCVFAVFGWLLSGNFIKHTRSRLFLAGYAALERIGFLAIAVVSFWGAHQIRCLRSLMAWRGWTAMSRLSLSVMLIHWVMILSVIGRRTHLVDASLFTMLMEGSAIGFSSYMLAIPLTLLVEMPAQMFMDTLIA